MKKNKKLGLKKKLRLNKETIVTLTPGQQVQVVGGISRPCGSVGHCAVTV
jgi:hypothetical protein